MNAEDPGGFSTIVGRPQYYIDFLDARTEIPDESVVKETILRLLDLRDGLAVLDVGSGIGADTIEVAKRVGPAGRVVGLDRSAEMVAEARGRADRPVEFVEGDAHRLEFDDATFDRCRSERMLIHVADPVTAVGEMVRVTRPGGLVVLSDIDAGTMFLNSTNVKLATALAQRTSDALAHGWLGRRQQRYLVEAGLEDVRCVAQVIQNSVSFMRIVFAGPLRAMVADGVATAGEVDDFWAELAQGERDGWLCSGVVCFTVVGRRPR
ncbi:methyltransferase domain-containing protein [Fodinicola acaciae]|uniref:methyltransferase domain-containing protein n=1 Tax=Fodinicola acaciae TaxID=2681555 RepID=UPI0013CF55CE|nr:methyltransferase domain-containing protein [Fodinicola acaciae]